jgi:transglutaminase-like putative cysteine protease
MERIDVIPPDATLLHTEKTVGYEYPDPAREIVTKLRLFPQAHRGPQRLLSGEIEVWPRPARSRQFRDEFGNEVVELFHEAPTDALRITAKLVTEHRGRDPRRSSRGRLGALHGVPTAGVGAFLVPSELADATAEAEEIAREVAPARLPDLERVERIGKWVYDSMRFQKGVTHLHTPASVALQGRAGVCQDFAHVMLAICRAAGLPARYVSGFVPGEGYMHAWVETLVREQPDGGAYWFGFDATQNRATDGRYLAVAVGRDYRDIAPLSGTFLGSAPGRLETWTRTRVDAPTSPQSAGRLPAARLAARSQATNPAAEAHNLIVH